MVFSLFKRETLPAALVASRDRALELAAHRLSIATTETATARKEVTEHKAGLASVEEQLAGLAHPGIEDAAIDAYTKRKTLLETKAEGFRRLIADREEKQRTIDQAVAEARAALGSAKADLDAPPAPAAPTAGDLKRLQAEEAKASARANEANRKVEQAEREGAPALEAYAGLDSAGAAQDDARRILAEYRRARDKIKAARAELREREAEADEIERECARIEDSLDRDQRVTEFETGLKALERHRAALDATVGLYDVTGSKLGSLVFTCQAWVSAYKNRVMHLTGDSSPQVEQLLVNAPHFLEKAVVPRLNSEGYFVCNHWRHSYSDFEIRHDLLDPLIKALNEPRVQLHDARSRAFNVFNEEYVRLSNIIVACAAALYGWRSDRERLFANAKDIARGYDVPIFPVRLRGTDWAFWRDLSLPSLKINGPAIWDRNWAPEKLLDLTKEAAAA